MTILPGYWYEIQGVTKRGHQTPMYYTYEQEEEGRFTETVAYFDEDVHELRYLDSCGSMQGRCQQECDTPWFERCMEAEAYTHVSEYDTLNLALEQSRLNASNWLSFPVIVSPSAGVTIQSCLESGFVAKVVLSVTFRCDSSDSLCDVSTEPKTIIANTTSGACYFDKDTHFTVPNFWVSFSVFMTMVCCCFCGCVCFVVGCIGLCCTRGGDEESGGGKKGDSLLSRPCPRGGC